MLVVNGALKTELVDLGGPNTKCDLPDFPIEFAVSGSVGFNNVNGPTICGGYKFDETITNACINLNSDHQWESLTNMTTPRLSASVTHIGSEEFLIIGGLDDAFTDLKSTEIVGFSGSEASEDLPFTIAGHCTLKINETTALICGGTQNGQDNSDATWFMDLITFKIQEGPRLQTGRLGHGCATLNLDDKNYVIITGGAQRKPEYKVLDTTEILDLQDLQTKNPIWKPGK